MELLTKNKFEELAAIHHPHCISIYISTHRTNEKGEGRYLDKTRLKNELKNVREALRQLEEDEREIDKHLKRFNELLEDSDFWSHQSDSLALFQADDKLHKFSVPIDFEPFSYVDDHLNLKPIVNLLNDTAQYNILALSLNSVNLYEANRNAIYKIEVADLIPQELTDTVGKDYEEKHLESSHSDAARSNETMFHGHGESNDTVKKEEALRFFQQIDNGLQNYLNKKKLPLIVASVDYLFPIYQSANSYHHLHEQHIGGNPEEVKLDDLNDQAWDIVRKRFKEKLKAENEEFNNMLNEGKSSAEPKEVIPAAIEGKVKTLMLKENTTLWGKYNREKHQVIFNESRMTADSDLINMAVIKTIENGGKVYRIHEKDMPVVESELAAIYRY